MSEIIDDKMSNETESKPGCELGNKLHGFGFGGKKPHNYKKKSKHLGKFVCFEQNGHTVLGILHNINTAEGCAEFMPYVVGKGDGFLVIVKRGYKKIDFPLITIRTMAETMEEYVKGYNAELTLSRNRSGAKYVLKARAPLKKNEPLRKRVNDKE